MEGTRNLVRKEKNSPARLRNLEGLKPEIGTPNRIALALVDSSSHSSVC